MAHLEFSKEITALLVIDPYNEFIYRVRRPSTTGPPGSGPRKAVVVINSRIVGYSEVTAQEPSRKVNLKPAWFKLALMGLHPGLKTWAIFGCPFGTWSSLDEQVVRKYTCGGKLIALRFTGAHLEMDRALLAVYPDRHLPDRSRV